MACWGLFARLLMALSMLACVTFNVGMRGLWACCSEPCEKETSDEEGANRLRPSSAMLRVDIWLKLCKRRRMTAP